MVNMSFFCPGSLGACGDGLDHEVEEHRQQEQLVDTAAAAVIVDTRRISGGGCALQPYTDAHTGHTLTTVKQVRALC
jgi:hypothetical protein